LPLDEFHARGGKTAQSVADWQQLAIVAFEQQSKAIAMKPTSARALMITITLAYVISAVVIVNSYFSGSFIVGLLIIVLPFLVLSFSMPHVLLVRCPSCGEKMRFSFNPSRHSSASSQFYAYRCDRCGYRHEWEGATSGSLD
jgi:predicted RNA-binding Zn-ribbon protein involved in translation (DUF1610 family)